MKQRFLYAPISFMHRLLKRDGKYLTAFSPKLVLPALAFFLASATAQSAESGSFTIHLILHAIGEEHYQLTTSPTHFELLTTIETSDRGTKRSSTSTLLMNTDYSPLHFEGKSRPLSARVADGSASVQENSAVRSMTLPENYFTVFGSSPFAIQEMMMRYWAAHGKPARLNTLRAAPGSLPLEIVWQARDGVAVNGEAVALDRYVINNLQFGREILWMDLHGHLAAAMTFAGGLPMEAIRSEFLSALPQLYAKGVSQEMAGARQPLPVRSGDFAITGARLIDGTGAPPVTDATVVIRNGRIQASGARERVQVPRGIATFDAKGLTLLPGLWEMHTHFSGSEFGPALLASGITTARDCGGEFDFLVAQRNGTEKNQVVGPRLLLAGLLDSGGLKAFGHITADTPAEGIAAVRRYHEARFQQIKLYTNLSPEVVRAVAAEAHRLGMTVTGHVPSAMNAFEGVEAGMDQINHLGPVANMMRSEPRGPIDVNSEVARKAIQFFHDHHTVVDPTAGWGEMASHSKAVDVARFEPGILKSPFVLDSKFRGMGGDTTEEQMHSRTAQSLAAIGALHKAGVTIVPGSDTGLVGYGLHRELELYVEAGMTPMEAIQCATIVSARAMNLDSDSGTVEPGKRADLVLVKGDPLEDIKALRNVRRVITNGRMFDAGELWKSVGFQP